MGLLSSFLWANEAYDIAKKSDEMSRNFGDEKTMSVMYLVNSAKDTVVRKMVNMTLERKGGKDYSIIQFLNPADVRGTGLLTHQNPKGDDKQWLYLPDLRRVKKISSSNKSGSFQGSEFTYEDISANTLDKWEYKKIGEEKLGSIDCYLLEKKPNYKNSGYSKVKVWVSKENFLGQRQEYFDRKGSLLKVQAITGWEKIGDSWRFGQLLMKNIQNGKSSSMKIESRKSNNGFSEKSFKKSALKRQIKF